jgi:hypothetical protein
MHKQLWEMKVKLNRPWQPLTIMGISRLERAGRRRGRWPAKASLQQLMEFFGVDKDVLFPEIYILNKVPRYRPDKKEFKNT